MRIGRFRIHPLDLGLVIVPVAVIMKLVGVPPVWMFVISGVAIIPLAGLMGRATEHLAERVGHGIGGLLNASFGNAAELIIAILALRRGLYDVVKASITGSIIGNILLVLGLAILIGGARFSRQQFNKTAAVHGATTLALAAIGLLVPAVFHFLVPEQAAIESELSLAIAIVLFATYGFGLFFALKTHTHLYGDRHETDEEALVTATWSKRRALVTLVAATAGVAVIAEFLVGAVEHTAHQWGMTEVFVGVILVAIVGNAAEHSTAVIIAAKNKVIDLPMNIAIGSGIQIALFVAPVLIFLSYAIGEQPLDLVFTPFEVLAVTVSVAVVSLICLDGESHWMEGLQLLAVYIILGIAFFFLPGSGH